MSRGSGSGGSGSGAGSQGEMVWKIVVESAYEQLDESWLYRLYEQLDESWLQPVSRDQLVERAREEMQLQLVIGEEEELFPPLDPRFHKAEQKEGQQRPITKTQPCPSQ